MNKYTKYLYALFILVFQPGLTGAFDIKTRIDPSTIIPTSDSSKYKYTVGGGISANLDLVFFDMLSIGSEFGTYITPLKNSDNYSQFITGGLGVTLFLYPLSVLTLQAGGSGGVYSLSFNGNSISNLWWKIYGSAGIRLTPAISISAHGGFINFNGYSSNNYTGIFAGLSAQLSLDTKGSKGNIEVILNQEESIFPLFYRLYKQNKVGTLKIYNGESAEIRKVNVNFSAGDYTGSLFYCGGTDIIRKKGVVEIPLYSDFTESVQNFTENGKIPGEVSISYEILGSKKSLNKSIVIEVYNRNTFRWTDTASLASFISPNSPEVLDYSKYIVGIARGNLKTGLNRNMQFAMYLYEGLRTGGISYSKDSSTPYESYHQNPKLLDYIQYPFQTLSYKLGDYDDIGLLYASALESVGIKSAILALKNDFIIAYSLNIKKEKAEGLFNGTENLLIIDDEVWMPLALSVLREGFINSWSTAINKLNDSFKNNVNVEFVIIEDAWKTYSPTGIKGKESKFEKPEESTLKKEVEQNLSRYITSEFGPKINMIKNDIKKNGASSALYNKLGQLYIRAGLYEQAKNEFIKAVDSGSYAALINIGNLYMMKREFPTAKIWFKKALKLQPNNTSAIRAINRVDIELEL